MQNIIITKKYCHYGRIIRMARSDYNVRSNMVGFLYTKTKVRGEIIAYRKASRPRFINERVGKSLPIINPNGCLPETYWNLWFTKVAVKDATPVSWRLFCISRKKETATALKTITGFTNDKKWWKWKSLLTILRPFSK